MKPIASISLDLDNLWSYMKTHGDPGWQSFPSYLDTFIPLVLDVLDDLNLKITFFIVGQDAALEKNHDVLKLITEKGHEVGNHSFNHDPWLHLYPKDQIEREILDTEAHIQRVTDQKPIGFRGPGFTCNGDILGILSENDYLYDASTLPTYLGPLARAYYFRKSDLTDEEKEKRKNLYGSFSAGFRPVKPYFLQISDENKILEIPVTTIPVFKTPFHLSYLIYLRRFSPILMLFYLNLAIQMCKLTGIGPSFLLHPLDLIGGDKVQELSFFPGMDVRTSKKMEIFNRVLRYLQKYYDLISLNTFAESTIQQNSAKGLQILSNPIISQFKIHN